jgi:hypothetical protein
MTSLSVAGHESNKKKTYTGVVKPLILAIPQGSKYSNGNSEFELLEDLMPGSTMIKLKHIGGPVPQNLLESTSEND